MYIRTIYYTYVIHIYIICIYGLFIIQIIIIIILAEKWFLPNYDVCRSLFFAQMGSLPKNSLPNVALYLPIA